MKIRLTKKRPESLVSKKSAKRKKPINLNKLVEDYYDTGLYLAVTPDHEKVVGTGKTIKEAGEEANAKGCNNPVILRAPSKAITKSRMHF